MSVPYASTPLVDGTRSAWRRSICTASPSTRATADACYALPDATIRVMGLPAMARITKVPEERLTELAQSNPVFAPGPENYLRMGGLEAIWEGDLAAQLKSALAEPTTGDRRSALGLERGGRRLAQPVIEAVMTDSDVRAA